MIACSGTSRFFSGGHCIRRRFERRCFPMRDRAITTRWQDSGECSGGGPLFRLARDERVAGQHTHGISNDNEGYGLRAKNRKKGDEKTDEVKSQKVFTTHCVGPVKYSYFDRFDGIDAYLSLSPFPCSLASTFTCYHITVITSLPHGDDEVSRKRHTYFRLTCHSNTIRVY